MAIQWVSTPESIKANQPSVLAIVETLAAMAVSIWIAVKWETYLHIAIGASIAPLLLMRTNESCVRCTNITDQLYKPLDLLCDYETKNPFIGKLIYVPILLLAHLFWQPSLFIIARITAWVVTLTRQPLATVAAIPGNWRHATVVLDSKKWPHFLPSADNVSAEDQHVFEVPSLIKGVFDFFPHSLWEALAWFYLFVLMSFIIVPVFVYRWSLKSTAIIWFPLLWGMRSVRQAGKSFQDYLSSYVRSPISVIVVCISVSVVLMFLTKVVLLYEWTGFVEWWNATPLRRVLSLYVSPQEIQIWQFAMLINSIIAIGMYFLAVHWLVLIKYKQLTNEILLSNVFKVGLVIRPILTGYTIACTLYITIRVAFDLQWPALGTKLFPWM